ncbi:MAG: aminotransferase class III-fold pyridoxal phosphate-dependent enzyme [Opitutaceae bacterium]|nr:aminotransferase class III-fold pyridoxal phosphate-dependent enzyme [Opitutaceae bacterium]
MNVQELYTHAKTLIPGGTQLLSKRPENQAPGQWPAYFRQASGCTITDLDGRTYRDFGFMGIGACPLGYAVPAVDQAVIRRIQQGAMCTLNPAEEVALAEKLVALHPWAQQARFARCGGESMAIAVRLARARTGRSKVAVCGYHGWHDWYLAANYGKGDALGEHLLPGLSPNGVPRELAGTCLTFRANDLAAVRAILAENPGQLAAIVMEPMRYDLPQPGFLETIRELTAQHGIVLIFDEITSGWRYNLGGVHLNLKVAPDMAVFAKAISNGYPMGAIIGTRDVMEAAGTCFVSSTYWTEAIGPTAALATIAEHERLRPWIHFKRAGERVMAAWQEAARRHAEPISAHSSGPLSHFAFSGPDANVAKTIFTQQMLARNFLAIPAFYASVAHTDAGIDDYAAACDEVFHYLHAARARGPLAQALTGPEAFVGFRRLN